MGRVVDDPPPEVYENDYSEKNEKMIRHPVMKSGKIKEGIEKRE